MNKKISSLVLCFALGLSTLTPQVSYSDTGAKKIEAEKIAPGVEQELYEWQTRYGNIIFNVLKCDLNNKNLDLRVIAGQGSYTKRATVSQMVSQTNAVAAINGDYFNMSLQGAPLGPSVFNGELHSSPAVINGIFALGIDKSNQAFIEKMTFDGYLIASNGESFPIDGLNKTTYWYDPSKQESHTGTIQMYDDYWTSASRGHKTNSEALISQGGIIEKISIGKRLGIAVPKGKKILQFNGKAKKFIEENCQEGDQVTLNYKLLPERDWKLVIGGHAMLMDGGQVIPYTKSISAVGGIRGRSALGISQDRSTLWIVAAEGRTARSTGASLSTLAHFFKQLGAYQALNLDGGGSTVLVSKQLGSTQARQVIRPEGLQGERAVVNGLGIYNSLPKTGKLQGFDIDGKSSLFVGEKENYSVKRAWDTNLHPLNNKNLNLSFTSEEEFGSWTNLTFLAKKKGVTNIVATAENGIQRTKQIKIKDLSEANRLKIIPKVPFSLGKNMPVAIQAIDEVWKPHSIDPNVLKWKITGADGVYDNSTKSIFIKGFKEPWSIIKATAGTKSAQLFIENPAADYLKLPVNKTYYLKKGNSYPIDSPVIIQNNRTLVPLRFIVEAFDGKVEWNQEDKLVTANIKGHQFILPINSKTVEFDGKTVILDSPATITKNYTYVRIRFISESIGLKVGYDNIKNIVYIAE